MQLKLYLIRKAVLVVQSKESTDRLRVSSVATQFVKSNCLHRRVVTIIPALKRPERWRCLEYVSLLKMFADNRLVPWQEPGEDKTEGLTRSVSLPAVPHERIPLVTRT